ncbi:Hypothetical protein D9617_1g086980 [Elsinoe fawcettii]|nr:Hypothetical protein D9617_1g086980 [Elsinoe fawcettii]
MEPTNNAVSSTSPRQRYMPPIPGLPEQQWLLGVPRQRTAAAMPSDRSSISQGERDISDVSSVNTRQTSRPPTPPPKEQAPFIPFTEKTTHTCWKSFLAFATKWWLWEVSGLLVAFGCYIAIVVILAQTDDTLVSDWSSTVFTLNSLIALLSTIMRTALMVPVASAIGQQKWLWFQKRPGQIQGRKLIDMELIDSASRGPWGSIVLLVKRHRMYLGLLGAILTITSLGLGTFTQLVLTTTSVSNDYRLPAPARAEQFALIQGDYSASLNLLTSLQEGFLSDAKPEPMMPDCPTGNCDWPEFPTLAICGSCTDMTTYLREACNQTTNLDRDGPALGSGPTESQVVDPNTGAPLPFGPSDPPLFPGMGKIEDTSSLGSFGAASEPVGESAPAEPVPDPVTGLPWPEPVGGRPSSRVPPPSPPPQTLATFGSPSQKRSHKPIYPRQFAPTYCTHQMPPSAGFGYPYESTHALPNLTSYLDFKHKIPTQHGGATKSRTPIFRVDRPPPENIGESGKRNVSDFYRLTLRHAIGPLTSKP